MTKLIISGQMQSKDCNAIPEDPAMAINLSLLILEDNLQRKYVPAIALAVYSMTTVPAHFKAAVCSI